MLSSLILSMAMSASPAPVIESDSLIINEFGRIRGSVKVNDQKLHVNTIGRIRGSVKVNDQKLDVNTIGRIRGSVKVQGVMMINLFKTLFVTKTKANPIATSIVIEEMPASVWWK